MPTTDIPYIVAVVREKEKALLEDDEYIRVINSATTADGGREALADTAYGIHVASGMTSLQALDGRLAEEFAWLTDMLGVSDASLTFIAARYDGLHAAAALIDYKRGAKQASMQVPVGRMKPELLTSVIWNDAGWDDVPGVWQGFLREQRAAINDASWSSEATAMAASEAVIDVMTKTGRSALMRAITALTAERLAHEKTMRPDALPSDIPAYEKQWDEKLLATLREHRLAPHTIDAVIAWWYALVIEVKTLRLLLTAAGGGVAKEKLSTLTRSRYLLWI